MKPTIFLLAGLAAVASTTPSSLESEELIHRHRPLIKTKDAATPLSIIKNVPMANILRDPPMARDLTISSLASIHSSAPDLEARDMMRKKTKTSSSSSPSETASSEEDDDTEEDDTEEDADDRSPQEIEKCYAGRLVHATIHTFKGTECSGKQKSKRLSQSKCRTFHRGFSSYDIELGNDKQHDIIKGQGCEVFVYNGKHCKGDKLGYHHVDEGAGFCENALMQADGGQSSGAKSAKFVCPGRGYRAEVAKGPEAIAVDPIGSEPARSHGTSHSGTTKHLSHSATGIGHPPHHSSVETVFIPGPPSHKWTKTSIGHTSHHSSTKTTIGHTSHRSSIETVFIPGPPSQKLTRTAIAQPPNHKTTGTSHITHGPSNMTGVQTNPYTIFETVIRSSVVSPKSPVTVSAIASSRATTFVKVTAGVKGSSSSSSRHHSGKSSVSCKTFWSDERTHTKTHTLVDAEATGVAAEETELDTTDESGEGLS